ncbi:GNAT family N-acetyltransferase [Methylobacterium sp. Leaf123]|uniref:GNAT family N-acetyltransferase n=1 Tax=Methylobacterium sp. Leaf123 TaxID=1736264 RepID=UPI0012E7E040|nr:GNAT family N-acetyltransferase [Methylobacterium sp. Leaf123]
MSLKKAGASMVVCPRLSEPGTLKRYPSRRMANIPSGSIPVADRDMFRDSETMSVTIPVTEEFIDWWDRHFLQPHKLTPQAVADILLRDLKFDEKVTFYRCDMSDARNFVQVSIEGSVDSYCVYMAGHSFHVTQVPKREVQDRHIEIDLVNVKPEYQGQGISAAVMANTYDLAGALGMTVMTVEAYLEGGPYAWPSYGFIPLLEYWPVIQAKMEDKLLELGSQVPPDIRQRLEPVLSATEPRAIFALLDEDLLVKSRGADGTIRRVTLARALLADTDQRWYGVLDLEDSASKSLFFECIARNER